MRYLSPLAFLLCTTAFPQSIFQRVIDCNSGYVRTLTPAPNNGVYASYDLSNWDQLGTREGTGLIRYNAGLDPVWSTTLLAPGGNNSLYLHEVTPCADGGILLCGAIYNFLQDTAVVAKLNGDGNVLWAKRIPSTLPPDANPSSSSTWDKAIELSGGDFLLMGVSGYYTDASHPTLLFSRISATGTAVWTKELEGDVGFGAGHLVSDAVALTNGDVLIAGYSGGEGNGPWLMRMQGNGTVDWQKHYGASEASWGDLTPMRLFPVANGYDLMLQFPSTNSRNMMCRVHVDPQGNLLDAQVIKSTELGANAHAVARDAAGNYIGVGQVSIPTVDWQQGDALAFGFNAQGETQWAKGFGSLDSETAGCVIATADGGVLMGGGALYENIDEHRGGIPAIPYFVKTNAAHAADCGSDVSVTSNDTTISVSNVTLSTANVGGWANTTLDTESGLPTITVCGTTGIAERNSGAFAIHPNPASTSFSIANITAGAWMHELVDAAGRVLLTVPSMANTTTIDVRSIADGRYILRSRHADEVRMTQVLIVH